MKKILVTVTLLLIASLCTFAAPKADKKSKIDDEIAVKAAIENRDYIINVNHAIPSSGRNVPLSSVYDVRVVRDSIICHLPYFGRAYSIPYGGGEGLIFTTTISDYTQEVGKRGVTKITFQARTKEDLYRFAIDVFPNGSSSIWVQPNNKQTISFLGEMRFEQDKKTDKLQ